MIKLAHYNKLPPRQQDIDSVLRILKKGEPLQLKDIIAKSKLTRTQVLCSLEALLNSGEVIIESARKPKLYLIANRD
ncbi:hypothetical protein D9M68_788350 [compost metagenome]